MRVALVTHVKYGCDAVLWVSPNSYGHAAVYTMATARALVEAHRAPAIGKARSDAPFYCLA